MWLLLVALVVSSTLGQECQEGRVTPDPGQCDKYWTCRSGEAEWHLCPDGLVFDPSTAVAAFQVGTGAPASDGSRCSYPFAIDCRGRRELQTPRPTDNCPRENGYFAVEGTCDQYWFCGGDKPAAFFTCPVSLVFSQEQGRCTWVGEANRPECKATDTFHQDFLCPEAGFGVYLRYPDPLDCRAYYICVSGTASRNICPTGEAFLPSSTACAREAGLPLGLCKEGQLWEDRNSTDSGAPTVVVPRTRSRTPGITRSPVRRVKEPFSNFPVQDVGNSLGFDASVLVDREAGDEGRVGLDCSTSGCHQASAKTQEKLGDSSVLVGQQKAGLKTLFLDDQGQTTTTAIPPRLRTRTRIRTINRTRTPQKPVLAAQVEKTEAKVAAPRRRTRVRGGVSRPGVEPLLGAVSRTRTRPVVGRTTERSAVGQVLRTRTRTRMRGSVRRPQPQETEEEKSVEDSA